MPNTDRPNLVFVFADQMRAQDTGFMGNGQVRTPHLDRTASEGVVFTNAVSTCPVCTPYRAALLTGRYPLSNGMILNDVRLPITERSIAHCFRDAGYQTAYIGKWHLDGNHRGGFTPPGPRRQGFDYWAVANCTHDYMHSFYFRDDPEPLWIDGYDADHFTDLTVDFIRERHEQGPFCLFLSWGPPHDPYQRMPEEYLTYDPAGINLRPNVSDTCGIPQWPEDARPSPTLDATRQNLAGYYAHITALDRCWGRITSTLDELGLSENTIAVFTSDHGDMLGSQGLGTKQKPWDESVMVPFMLKYPRLSGAGRRVDTLLNAPDLMPTLLSLAGLKVPETVEGIDLSGTLTGEPYEEPTSAFISDPAPFAEPIPEWRGVRTKRHTYARTLQGPWLLYDNEADPYQMNNLVDDPAHRALRDSLDAELDGWLQRLGDDFEPRRAYWDRFGYSVDKWLQKPFDNEVGYFPE